MRVTVIAELGINHNGNLDLALKMIEQAAKAGCDGVKVQSYRVEDFLEEGHTDWDLFKRCEIWPYLPALCGMAHECDLLFGVTPTSPAGVAEAVDAGADYLKNGSDALLYRELIEAMVATGLPVWVSTGMANKTEIVSLPEGCKRMLCTSIYPCPPFNANLARFRRGLYQGYSDHTTGTIASLLACALGAEMIEKHFTLSNEAKGPDHAWSANPASMTALVRQLRVAETLLGDVNMRYKPIYNERQPKLNWRWTGERKRPA